MDPVDTTSEVIKFFELIEQLAPADIKTDRDKNKVMVSSDICKDG